MSNWYYKKSGQEFGPLPSAELKQLAILGQLSPDDSVRREDMHKWTTANRVQGLFAKQTADRPAPPSPTVSGAATPALPATIESTDEKHSSPNIPSVPQARQTPRRRISKLVLSTGIAAVGICGIAVATVVFTDWDNRPKPEPLVPILSPTQITEDPSAANRESEAKQVAEEKPNDPSINDLPSDQKAFNEKSSSPLVNPHTLAEQLVKDGRLHLSGHICCLLYDAQGHPTDAFTKDDADTLLKIAQQKSIFIFMHGFRGGGGNPSTDEVKDFWSAHLRMIADKGEPFAACLLQTDTLLGFGDHDPDLGNLIFAIRWLTDQPAIFSPDRRVFLVGVGVGGNYLKNAVVLFQRNNKASGVPEFGSGRTPMRILFLATPHRGAPAEAVLAAGKVAIQSVWLDWKLEDNVTQQMLGKKITALQQNEDKANRDRVIGESTLVANSPGMKQLVGNSDLSRANEQFWANAKGNYEVLNIYSPTDALLPLEWGSLGTNENNKVWNGPGILNVPVEVGQLGHSFFTNPANCPDDSLPKLVADFYRLNDRHYFEYLNLKLGEETTGKPPEPLVKAQAYSGISQPTFAILEQPRTPTSLAIERYLRTRFIGGATDAQVIEVCDSMAHLFDATPLPDKYRKLCFSKGTEKEPQLTLWRLMEIVDGDSPPPEVKAQAEHLSDQMEDCIPPRMLLNAPFAIVGESSRYLHKFLPPKADSTSGYRGPGALMREELEPLRQVIDLLRNRNDQISPLAYMNMLKGNGEDIWILRAEYRSEARHRCYERIYWYQKIPDAINDILDKLPKNHPIFNIRPARDSAPERLSD